MELLNKSFIIRTVEEKEDVLAEVKATVEEALLGKNRAEIKLVVIRILPNAS